MPPPIIINSYNVIEELLLNPELSQYGVNITIPGFNPIQAMNLVYNDDTHRYILRGNAAFNAATAAHRALWLDIAGHNNYSTDDEDEMKDSLRSRNCSRYRG